MIGLFDSGLGGLSAFLPLTELLPNADLFYYADTAALPLGERTDTEIRERLHAALSFFDAMGASGVLLACGTASSLLTEKCKEKFSFPILDIITPTLHAVRSLPKDARVLLLATQAAVRSERFSARLSEAGHTVYALPCPSLVRIAEGEDVSCESVTRALLPAIPVAPAAIVLGCTHFSLLKREIARAFNGAHLIDAAACAALAAADRFENIGGGNYRFFVTADKERFSDKAAKILGFPVNAEHIRFRSASP